MEDLLPVGSIVELKDKKRKMIIGYLPSKPNDKEFYDYICCNSKIGIRKPKEELKEKVDYTYLNQDEIERVIYIGCQDKEFDLYKMVHAKIKDKLLEARKENKELTNEELEEMYSKVFEGLYREIESKIETAKKAKKEKEEKEKENKGE